MRSKQKSLLAVALTALIGTAALAGPAAIAEKPSLSAQIDAASAERDRLAGAVGERSATIAGLDSRARAAGAKAMQLAAEVRTVAARSDALREDLDAAEDQLDRVRDRLGRAVAVLADRLVEIYKGGSRDQLSVILGAEDFNDLEARAEFLEALNDEDSRVTDRVTDLRDQVAERYDEIAAVKETIDDEARRLDSARAGMVAAERDARERADELSDLLEGDQAELAAVRDRVAELEAEQAAEQAEQAEQAPAGGSYEGGPYSIPTYIVMCESGGNYRAYNPSSGAGGAYQIIPSTWAAYGGRGRAHTASKAEQDRIAALIWADVGASAWSCA